MIPLPYKQVDEFLSWLNERHPSAQREREGAVDPKEVIMEYLRTRGRREALSPTYALEIFQICPMIYERDVREQMKHFVSCGGCLHYIHEQHREYPRRVLLHPLLDGFRSFCEENQLFNQFSVDAEDLAPPAIREGPEYIENLFRQYIHRIGPEYFDAFEKYLEVADKALVRDFETRRDEWRESFKRPSRPTRDWTEPLGMSEQIERAAERLIGSVYLLLEGGFYKGAEESPHDVRSLADLGLVSEDSARGVEFVSWLREKYPDLDLFGNIPAEEIDQLVSAFCNERNYPDPQPFASRVLGWIRGETDQLILRRLSAARAGTRGRPVSSVALAGEISGEYAPRSAIFLSGPSTTLPSFLKKYWRDLNYLTARHVTLYYSVNDAENRLADPDVVQQLRVLSEQVTPLPTLLLWEKSVREVRPLPLEGLSDEQILDVVKIVVRGIIEKRTLDSIGDEADSYITRMRELSSHEREVISDTGGPTMKLESFSAEGTHEPSGGGGSRHGGDGGFVAPTRVPYRNFDEISTNLVVTGRAQLAEALRAAREAVMLSPQFTDMQKEEMAEVFLELGEEASRERPNYTLLKSLCEGLRTTLRGDPAAARAVAAVSEALQKPPGVVVDTTQEMRIMLERLEEKERKRFRNTFIFVSIPVAIALGLAIWVLWQAQTLKTKTEELRVAQQGVEEQRQALDSIRTEIQATDDASEQIRLGVIQYHARNYTAAIAAYDKAIELDPLNPVAYDLKGYSQLKNGEVQGAIESFNRSIEIDPSYVWSHYDLALAYWANGDTSNAIREVKTVLDIDPNLRSTIRNDGQFEKFKVSSEFRNLVLR